MSNSPLLIERTFDAPIEKVWRAISDPIEMKKWYFDIPDFKPEVGCEVKYTVEHDNIKYPHVFKVTEVIPGKKLSYSWRYEGYHGSSVVHFELFPEGDMTKLKLTHEGLETFEPAPEMARERFNEGWTQLIGTSLKEYLQKN
jgi:uncharacterized protein YndB with AHSA1/START domain